MRGILILALICFTAIVCADDKLKCYQCSPVTDECAADKAEEIKCGTIGASKCLKQVKKGSSDATKAIRKCVVPDSKGEVPCPNNFDCFVCDKELCNAGSIAKFAWISLVGVFFALYAL